MSIGIGSRRGQTRYAPRPGNQMLHYNIFSRKSYDSSASAHYDDNTKDVQQPHTIPSPLIVCNFFHIFYWSRYLKLVLLILKSKLSAGLPKSRCIVHFSAGQREKSVSVSVRGSATGLLIAVEPKSSHGGRRFGGAENSSCHSPGSVHGCLQTVDNIPSTGARIIHIFTGSQINSPPTAPRGRNLKTGGLAFDIWILSKDHKTYF